MATRFFGGDNLSAIGVITALGLFLSSFFVNNGQTQLANVDVTGETAIAGMNLGGNGVAARFHTTSTGSEWGVCQTSGGTSSTPLGINCYGPFEDGMFSMYSVSTTDSIPSPMLFVTPPWFSADYIANGYGLAGATGTHIAGGIFPFDDGENDVGFPGFNFRTGYFSNDVIVNGQSTCLEDGTNCPASGGGTITSSTWQFNQSLGLIYPTTSTFAMVLGSSASATAPFYWETRSPTSSLQIGRVGNANLFVGTSTYGGGLNAAFTLNGDDAFIQSNLGVLGIGYFGTVTSSLVYGDIGLFGSATATRQFCIGNLATQCIDAPNSGQLRTTGTFRSDGPFLPLSGISSLGGDILPAVTNLRSLGSASLSMLNIYASGTVVVGTNVTVGGQSVCLANGTNCPSSYVSLTITTLSSTNINVRNIREANGSTASSTITLSGRSAEIDTSATTRPTSSLLVVGGVPRTLPAMNATSVNCVYWGPEFIRDAWDGLQLKPTISWTNATGSGAVVWRLRIESISDAESIGTGWTGTVAYATGTAGTAMLNQNDAMDALTSGGATTGTPMRFELCRNAAQAGDTLGTDAYPNSLKIEYGLASYSDN